ncbi:MAG: isoprenylcysteine carboxylmethyltransferase family protein [Candidatus Thermoplasmatota archaeon]|nr:isoprenylcysteine carboxylmethyltransferase family protein [Candidatus Thermoplasmatota archaeon]
MFKYKPPKELRALFIAHYAPILLIIMVGPLTAFYNIWQIPLDKFLTIFFGLIIFLIGTYIYFKWEIFWYKTFKGQLVTTGIFSYIRHPHYTSLIFVGLGLALFFYSIFALVIAIIAIPIIIWSILDEEKHLIKQFGKEYIEFMKKNPWRIIPMLY